MSEAVEYIYTVVLKEKAGIRLIRQTDLSMTFGMKLPDSNVEKCITIPIK